MLHSQFHKPPAINRERERNRERRGEGLIIPLVLWKLIEIPLLSAV